jgi:hypothetical protein
MQRSCPLIKTHVNLHACARHCCPILTQIEMCRQVLVNSPVANFMKIRSAVLDLLHAYRWTYGQSDSVGAPQGCEHPEYREGKNKQVQSTEYGNAQPLSHLVTRGCTAVQHGQSEKSTKGHIRVQTDTAKTLTETEPRHHLFIIHRHNHPVSKEARQLTNTEELQLC